MWVTHHGEMNQNEACFYQTQYISFINQETKKLSHYTWVTYINFNEDVGPYAHMLHSFCAFDISWRNERATPCDFGGLRRQPWTATCVVQAQPPSLFPSLLVVFPMSVIKTQKYSQNTARQNFFLSFNVCFLALNSCSMLDLSRSCLPVSVVFPYSHIGTFNDPFSLFAVP